MAPARPDEQVRQHAGVLDRSSRGRIAVRGADRQTFLHALLTNDITGLAPGTGCYAALLTPQGRMIADMHVLELGDVILIDCPRPVKDTLLEKLDAMLFGEAVEFGDLTDAWGCVAIYGPLAPAVAGRILGGDQAAALGSLAPYGNLRIEALGDTVVAARIDGLGLPGIWIFAAMGHMGTIGNAAIATGATFIEPDLEHLLRVEAGEPEFLVDMTTETIPPEAGIEGRAISFTKGCFPGQEVIVRIRDRGHGRVAVRLVGLSLEGAAVPSPGDRLAADGADVGHVTSAVFSPSRGGPIALGYVKRAAAEEGRAVTVAHGAESLAARVYLLP